MSRINFYFNKANIAEEVVNYTISLPEDFVGTLYGRLLNNESIQPEIIGYLLGSAKLVTSLVTCGVCNNVIEKKDYFKPEDPRYGVRVHERCLKHENK